MIPALQISPMMMPPVMPDAVVSGPAIIGICRADHAPVSIAVICWICWRVVAGSIAVIRWRVVVIVARATIVAIWPTIVAIARPISIR